MLIENTFDNLNTTSENKISLAMLLENRCAIFNRNSYFRKLEIKLEFLPGNWWVMVTEEINFACFETKWKFSKTFFSQFFKETVFGFFTNFFYHTNINQTHTVKYNNHTHTHMSNVCAQSQRYDAGLPFCLINGQINLFSFNQNIVSTIGSIRLFMIKNTI